ncbi:MAG: ABC transporter substrate-binding protein [Nocardioidaceae bacterium]
MRLTSRTARAAVVVAGTALTLAACGSSSPSTTSPSTTTTTGSSGGGSGSTSPLIIGTLLPQTGDLAFLGPPEFAGVGLAIKDINKAGGVLGKPVQEKKADSGDGTPNIAPGNTTDLLDAGSQVIVGAASSSVSLSVIDQITGAGVVQISPANTSTAFDTYNDHGLYFRTAPSDVLQGAVMANLIASDGHSNIAILARQDSYGEALATQVDKVFTQNGGTVVQKVLYQADAATFGSEVQKIASSHPDAILAISFDEIKKIIPQMIQDGIGPKNVQIYFTDGDTADYSKDFPKGTLTGVRATYPGAELTNDFKQRLLTQDPSLTSFTYGPESYDAVVLAALAADAAGSTKGTDISKNLQAVSEGGTKCTDYATCAQMIKAGKDINYEGVSGPIDFNSTGSPSAATIGIFQYAADNNFHNVKYVTGQIAQ